jgi:hypothetical protein
VAGLSAKDSDSAIGYFGTGLKYSIACILRWGGEVTIYSGTQQYVFAIDSLEFRGKAFKQVVMRTYGQGSYVETPLGFTTEYGKDWKAWQVFRELYANARDEGGGVRLDTSFCPTEGETYILVNNLPELIEAYYDRDNIILPADKVWAQITDGVHFSPAECGHLYYRGVRVADVRCRYTWNFEKLGIGNVLTEDRSLKDVWSAQAAARNFIKDNSEDEKAIQFFIHASCSNLAETGFEAAAASYLIAPTSLHGCSETFAKVAARLYRREPVRFKAYRKLAEAFDSTLCSIRAYTMTPREQMMLAKAKELVSLFGYADEVRDIPIVVCNLGDTVLGKYEDGTIELSPTLFEQGTKQLVSTLYEECFHAKTGKADCTYDTQTSLFNTIISLNEELHNVIC